MDIYGFFKNIVKSFVKNAKMDLKIICKGVSNSF